MELVEIVGLVTVVGLEGEIKPVRVVELNEGLKLEEVVELVGFDVCEDEMDELVEIELVDGMLKTEELEDGVDVAVVETLEAVDGMVGDNEVLETEGLVEDVQGAVMVT